MSTSPRKVGGLEINGEHSYERAIETLNSLQSGDSGSDGHGRKYSDSIREVHELLERIDLKMDRIDNLSVIHVTGTKGKGTTCAYCESVLRYHGYRTGFFSSPHLVRVAERIKLNGASIAKKLFARHFFEVWDRLVATSESPADMPKYFRMLTLVAFMVFVEMEVDVAVVEVGVGGEYDSTNFLRVVPVVGITSIALDHTKTLGSTLDLIAWHKSGIMKKQCSAFTVPQCEEVMKVLRKRSTEKECTLTVVNPSELTSRKPHKIWNMNASLAMALAETWMIKNGAAKFDSNIAKLGLQNCQWPGRYQVVCWRNSNFYLDGAHTEESLQICVDWFTEETSESSLERALIFNNTKNRDSERHLHILQAGQFDVAYFVPNRPTDNVTADLLSLQTSVEMQMDRCRNHGEIWSNNNGGKVYVVETINEALEMICADPKKDVLVTGSVHLIGGVLSIIDEEAQH